MRSASTWCSSLAFDCRGVPLIVPKARPYAPLMRRVFFTMRLTGAASNCVALAPSCSRCWCAPPTRHRRGSTPSWARAVKWRAHCIGSTRARRQQLRRYASCLAHHLPEQTAPFRRQHANFGFPCTWLRPATLAAPCMRQLQRSAAACVSARALLWRVFSCGVQPATRCSHAPWSAAMQGAEIRRNPRRRSCHCRRRRHVLPHCSPRVPLAMRMAGGWCSPPVMRQLLPQQARGARWNA